VQLVLRNLTLKSMLPACRHLKGATTAQVFHARGIGRMQDWLKTFHGANQAFPAIEIAVKAAVALALGLLVGLELE